MASTKQKGKWKTTQQGPVICSSTNAPPYPLRFPNFFFIAALPLSSNIKRQYNGLCWFQGGKHYLNRRRQVKSFRKQQNNQRSKPFTNSMSHCLWQTFMFLDSHARPTSTKLLISRFVVVAPESYRSQRPRREPRCDFKAQRVWANAERCVLSVGPLTSGEEHFLGPCGISAGYLNFVVQVPKFLLHKVHPSWVFWKSMNLRWNTSRYLLGQSPNSAETLYKMIRRRMDIYTQYQTSIPKHPRSTSRQLLYHTAGSPGCRAPGSWKNNPSSWCFNPCEEHCLIWKSFPHGVGKLVELFTTTDS